MQGLAPVFQKRLLAAQCLRLAHPGVQGFNAFLRITFGFALELACLLFGKFGLALLLDNFFLFLRLLLKLVHAFGRLLANPDVANVLFVAGKIESWGRGIDLIRNACEAHGTPAPRFECDSAGFWVEVAFPEVIEPLITLVATLVKTPAEILRCLSANPTMTPAEVAAEIEKSLSAVVRASARLVKDRKLKHVGPQKGGHWEVLK